MPSNTEYRFATREDLVSFYKDDPVYYSARAVVIVKEGEVVGVGGVSCVNKQMVAFTDVKEGKVTPRDIVKVSPLMVSLLERYTSVVAFVDGKTKTAKSFGAHYGFEPTGVVTDEGAVYMKVTKKWNS